MKQLENVFGHAHEGIIIGQKKIQSSYHFNFCFVVVLVSINFQKCVMCVMLWFKKYHVWCYGVKNVCYVVM